MTQPSENRGVETLAARVREGDRKALARAVTLVESTRAGDRKLAERLLTSLLPHTGGALRIGISGAPGAGKSTYIEALGAHLTSTGTRLAVLAVDPSSLRSGGSILGDKTRMPALARNPRAFVRPSPAGDMMGGVARRTRETVLLAEGAGFDVVIVETVGVGQSETAVSGMVDLFVLLVAPASGDGLQGIKRGAMELADLLIVTKADGDLAAAASRAAADYRGALSLLRPKHPDLPTRIVKISSFEGSGIAESWSVIEDAAGKLRDGGLLVRLREDQLRHWFRSEVRAGLTEALSADQTLEARAAALEASVLAGRVLPGAAANVLIGAFLRLDGANPAP